ncbi:MAG: 16S rRNA (cytosine(967)-C(5))-methyltransferase [Thainema sp.]
MTHSPRQAAFLALKAINQKQAYADIALDQVLQRSQLSARDRRLATELVYGSVRRQRTLDALINQLATKPADQQPPDLRLILHLGLYQLRYLTQIPARAIVDTTVELAKDNRLKRLSGVVNGILRQYDRLTQSVPVPNPNSQPNQPSPHSQATTPTETASPSTINHSSTTNHSSSSITPSPSTPTDPLHLPANPAERLGILHSYPTWIVQVWYDQLQDWAAVERLCQYMNQTPSLDLRVNPLKTTMAEVMTAFEDAGIAVQPTHIPWCLRLDGHAGNVAKLPGFEQGWWTVQDQSAQLVAYLLDPQSDETVIDACAAPGGKTTQMAELMGDQGKIWACDRYSSRLKKVQQNCDRIGLQSVQLRAGDSCDMPDFKQTADRVLLDAPCSGLGTLHRHADARWRQTPDSIQDLAKLQQAFLESTATWVKPGGCLVYSTCTLHPAENEQVVQQFLATHSDWRVESPEDPLFQPYITSDGWLKVWPHQAQMDGFFMVKLQHVGDASQ